MNLNPPEKIFAFGCSPSMMQLWDLCKRKWWLHYVGKRGRGEKVDTKDAGTAIHNFFQTWYDEDWSWMGWEEHMELFENDFPPEESTEKRNCHHMKMVLKAYVTQYPRETEPFEVVSLEETLRIPVEGCQLPLNCKIDMLVRYHNGLWVMDHKSTSRMGATYFEQFRHNWQTYCYLYAAEKLRGERCHGIIYNAVGLRQKIDKDSFMRSEVVKNESQLSYHMKTWAKKVNEMYEFVKGNYENPEAFLMSPGSTACRAYNSSCFALDYCEYNANEAMLPE